MTRRKAGETSPHADHGLLLTLQRRFEMLIEHNKNNVGVLLRDKELASLTEELQITNEAINRRLGTADRELKASNEALARLNRDLQNLMDSVDAAVILLDQRFRIHRFTPAATQIFPLRASDRGRSLTEFTTKLLDVDVDADLEEVLRTRTIIEREVRIKQGNGTRALLMRIKPYRAAGTAIDSVSISFVDIDTETARYAALSRASGDAIIGLDLEGAVMAWSPGAERLLGYSSKEMIGSHISVLAPEGFEHERRALLQQIRHGHEVEPYDTMRRRKDGSRVHVAIRAAPMLSSQSIPIGISETMRDISPRKRAEQHNELLTRELSHRSKNLFSLVLATMTQTAQHSTSKQDFIKRLNDRVRAMSQANDLLVRGEWKGAPVRDLVGTSLAPFVRKTNLEMDGPDIILTADAVHCMSMVLHELATNAAKFGALTSANGKIAVNWDLDSTVVEPRFHISWRESGGPSALTPRQTGFGTEVITELPKYELDAKVTLKYAPAGLFWTAEMPAKLAVNPR